MQDLFPEVDVNEDEAEAIARGLYAVAKADGVLHDREAGLIVEFFASISDRPSDLAALDRASAIEPDTLALALASGDIRHLFLMTALLLAHADGDYGDGEQELIGEYATALEVSDGDLADMDSRVKEFLLSQLSHLANVDAAVEVAKDLKV